MIPWREDLRPLNPINNEIMVYGWAPDRGQPQEREQSMEQIGGKEMEGNTSGQKRGKGVIIFTALAVILVLVITTESLISMEIETEKTRYYVNETITAQLVRVNRLPFPVPSASITEISASVRVNGEATGSETAVHITPSSRRSSIQPGRDEIYMPIRFTPREVGEIQFVFKLSSGGSSTVVRKTVTVIDPLNTADAAS